jgi:hypothetical protein
MTRRLLSWRNGIPPPGISYKRVTPGFFAVSSVRKDRIWYNRCNLVSGYMNCILINYPRGGIPVGWHRHSNKPFTGKVSAAQSKSAKTRPRVRMP